MNKILTQNQTSEAESKGQLREVSKSKGNCKLRSYKLILLRNKILKQALRLISLLKVHKVAKQTNQRLPDTGDVSSLGLGALGAVLMTTSFALKGSKHSRK